MEFAIVRFLDEDDAPDIVATNWIENRNSCRYPNLRSDVLKNKLLISRANPTADWLQCRIRILKEFATYKAARCRLSQAEDTSNLDSGNESPRFRKRIKRVIRLPGEYSSSEEEVSCKVVPSSEGRYAYSSSPALSNSQRRISAPVRSCNCKNVYDEDALEGTSKSVSSRRHATSKSYYSESSLDSQVTPSPPKKAKAIRMDHEEEDSFRFRISEELEQLRSNQKNMECVLKESYTLLKNIQSKVDNLMVKMTENNFQLPQIENDEDTLLSYLPLGVDNFFNLESKIEESNVFKHKLMTLLRLTGGKDCRSLATNMIKKLMSDDMAEQLSLTGKTVKDGTPKQAFEKLAIYKLILESCSRVYPSSEKIIREAISEWLIQAKFRKCRRLKRAENNNSEDSSDVTICHGPMYKKEV